MTVTPVVGLIAGLILIAVAKLCYLWGFKEGRRSPHTLYIDPRALERLRLQEGVGELGKLGNVKL